MLLDERFFPFLLHFFGQIFPPPLFFDSIANSTFELLHALVGNFKKKKIHYISSFFLNNDKKKKKESKAGKKKKL